MILVSCNSCDKKYQIPLKYNGKKIACKSCGETISIPAADNSDQPARPPAAVRKARTPAKQTSKRKRRPPEDRAERPARRRPTRKKKPVVDEWDDPWDDDFDDDYEDDFEDRAPRRSPSRSKSKGRKKKKSPPSWLMPAIFSVVGLCAVGGVIFAAVNFLPGLFGHTRDSLAREHISVMTDIVELFESIETVDDAKACGPQLDAIASRADALQKAQKEFIEKEFNQDDNTSVEDQVEEIKRLAAENEERAKEFLAEVKALGDRARLATEKLAQNPSVAVAFAEEFAAFRERNPEMAGALRQSPMLSAFAANPPRNSAAPFAGSGSAVLTVIGGDPRQKTGVSQRVREIVEGASGNFFMTTKTLSGNSEMTIRPVQDFAKFVSCLDFGTVSNRNDARRSVTVTVSSSWTFRPNDGPTL